MTLPCRCPRWNWARGAAYSAAIFVFVGAVQIAHARELTSEVREHLFRATESVRLARRVVTIPMEGADRNGSFECPYFKVYINGRGPFTFLLDTGAAYTVVSTRVVEAAQTQVVFDRDGRRDVVRLRRIEIGGVTLRDVWAIHDDNYAVDGVLGFPAFGSSNVMFDLAHRRLTVSRLPTSLPGSFELPYDTEFNVPTVPLRIGDRTLSILIDTGDDAFGLEVRRLELGDARLAHEPTPAESVLNGATVQQTLITTLADRISLGPIIVDSPVLAINDDLPIGDMGYDFLRQFRFEIQPARRVVVFQPLFEGVRLELRGGMSPGFRFAFASGKVTHVAPGSVAESAGMTNDDVILSVDEHPPQFYDPHSWHERIEAGPPVVVRWTHEGAEYHGSFQIVESR